MFLLVGSFILAATLVPPVSDNFDDGTLDGWDSQGLEISDQKVVLKDGWAVGRAKLDGEANAKPDEDCKVSVRVDLGAGGRLHRRACVRIVRDEAAFVRVTVWYDPREKKEMVKLECGVVGEADTREASPPEEWTGESNVKLELVAKDGQLTATFEPISPPLTSTYDLSAGTGQTRFAIEAGGDRSLVRLADFEAEWTEPEE